MPHGITQCYLPPGRGDIPAGSGRRGRIAPAPVTPTGESILKPPRSRRDALSLADKSAAPCCCARFLLAQSNRDFSREQPPKLLLPLCGSGPLSNIWLLGPTRVHNQNDIAIGSSVTAWITVVSNTHRRSDHATSVSASRIFALRLLTTRSTQPCIRPGSLNRVPASAGLKAGMSPLPGGR